MLIIHEIKYLYTNVILARIFSLIFIFICFSLRLVLIRIVNRYLNKFSLFLQRWK